MQVEVERVSFVVDERTLKQIIRKWVEDNGNSIGPGGLELPEYFQVMNDIESGDASVLVEFDVDVS